MISLKDYLESINYKITGGSDYGWNCYGPNARYLDAMDSEGSDGTYSVHAIFDSVTQHVYEIQAWDYVNNREYRWIDPVFRADYEAEAREREIDSDESLDGQKYIDLDMPEDLLEKISAIVAGEDYDTRVKVPVDFTDDELLKYMKMAHDRDMTFNQFVEEALRHAIERHRNENYTSV